MFSKSDGFVFKVWTFSCHGLFRVFVICQAREILNVYRIFCSK